MKQDARFNRDRKTLEELSQDMIHFDIRTVYIRAILTHKEYDHLNKMNKLITL